MKTEERIKFASEMAETSFATQSDVTDEHYEVYWKAVGHWELEDFQAAMRKCRDDLNRFPTVAQIRERRPKSHRTAAEVIKHGGLMALEEDASNRGADDLEAEIDNLTGEELEAVIRLYAPFDRDRDMDERQVVKACRYIAEQFQRMPKSGVYRPYVRNAILKLKTR